MAGASAIAELHNRLLQQQDRMAVLTIEEDYLRKSLESADRAIEDMQDTQARIDREYKEATTKYGALKAAIIGLQAKLQQIVSEKNKGGLGKTGQAILKTTKDAASALEARTKEYAADLEASEKHATVLQEIEDPALLQWLGQVLPRPAVQAAGAGAAVASATELAGQGKRDD